MVQLEGTVATLRAAVRMVTVDMLTAQDARTAVTSSGTLLAGFLVLHAGGNAGLLAGRPAINLYGYVLHHKLTWAVRIVELYFLLGAVIHLLSALWITYSTGRFRTLLQRPFDWTVPHTFMAATGLLGLGFVVNHVLEFKFGAYHLAAITDPFTGEGSTTEDIGTKVVERLQDPAWCAFYIASSWVIAAHVYFGWRRAVVRPSTRLPSRFQGDAVALGSCLLAVAVVIYTVVPVLSLAGFL